MDQAERNEPANLAEPPARGGRLRRVGVRLGLLAASGVLALAAGEVAVRAVGLGVPPRSDAGAQSMMRNVPDEEAKGVLFELRPGWTGTTLYPGVGDEAAREVRYTINSLGFRGPETVVEKPEGVFRIAVLGDSFTYGTGVDDEYTWPAMLSKELRSAVPGRRIEVQNWGVPAYNTRQQIAQLNQRAQAYAPDLVLLCAYMNDASGEARRGAPAEAAADPPWEVRWIARLGLTSGRWTADAPMTDAQRRMMWLRERSKLIDLAAYKLHGRLTGRVTHRNYVEDWQEGSAGRAMVKSALSFGVVLARRQGFELVCAMYPDIPSLGRTYAFAEQHAAFGALCDELQLPFHDLTSVFDGQDPTQLTAHAHDKHPNAAANALVAAELARLLAPRIQGE